MIAQYRAFCQLLLLDEFRILDLVGIEKELVILPYFTKEKDLLAQ